MNLIILLFPFLLMGNDCSNMPEIREAYGNIKTEQELLTFIDLIGDSSCDKVLPYLASAEMQKAQFAFAPWTKYRHFRKGKKQLEAFIKNNPDNIEARYIRFLVQTHVPFFLAYSKEIKEDKEKINKLITKADLSPKYKEQMMIHINKFKKQTEKK